MAHTGSGHSDGHTENPSSCPLPAKRLDDIAEADRVFRSAPKEGPVSSDGRFDTTTGRRLGFLEGTKAPICSAVLLADGKTAATTDYVQDKLWDLKTQKELVTLGGERLAYFALALSPGGERLAAGSTAIVRLWDPTTRQQVALLKTPSQSFRDLAFSADGNMLVLVDAQTLQVWRAPSMAEIDAAEAKQKSQ